MLTKEGWEGNELLSRYNIGWQLAGWHTALHQQDGRIRLSGTYSKPRIRTLGIDPHEPFRRIDFIRLGSVTTNRKGRLTGEQLTVGIRTHGP